MLTGRVISIAANAQLSEKDSQYVYLGERVQRGRQRELGFFAQDAWRARPNLTLNYGLRWELHLPFTPLNDSYTTSTIADLFGISGAGNLFKPGTLTGRETQFEQYKKGDQAYNVDYKNIGPTFGFAWRVGAKDGWLKRLVGEDGKTVLRGGYSIAYTRPGIEEFSSEFGANLGQLHYGFAGPQSRQPGRGEPGVAACFAARDEPARPGCLPTHAELSVHRRNQQRRQRLRSEPEDALRTILDLRHSSDEIAKNMAVEARYVGNRSLRGWTEYNLNEVNIVENGFLNEFRLAQSNLRANIAAGRGNTFAYTGAPGTAPLPIIAGYFNGLSGAAVNDPARYTSTQFTSTTFVNLLAAHGPAPTTFASTLYNDAGRRANALAANLPVNLFLVNPGLPKVAPALLATAVIAATTAWCSN